MPSEIPPPKSPDAPVSRATFAALITLAWPIIISRSTQVVMGLGDSVMVSHLGESGLAAVTTGAFNTFVILILPIGIIGIVNSFASQLCGAGDLPGARRYGFYGLLVALLTAIVGAAFLPALDPVLRMLSYAPEVREQMYEYLWIRLLSVGPAIAIEALGAYYGGIGNTRLPMVINVAAMGLDLLGNWLFIGGHWGAPALGVAGAAWSSTLSTVLLSAVFFVRFLVDGRREAFGHRLIPKLHGREAWRMFRVGLPNGLNFFFEFFAFNIFINLVVADLGTVPLAAFMSVFQLNSVAFTPALAIAIAGSILVGQHIGAAKKDEVPGIVRKTLMLSIGWQGTVSLAYLFIPAILLEPFANEHAKAAGYIIVGARMLRLSTAWQVFDALGMTVSEALRAAGDTQFAMWTRLLLAWFVFIPGAWVTVKIWNMGDLVAVGWVVFYIAALGIAVSIRFVRGSWRRIELVHEPAPL